MAVSVVFLLFALLLLGLIVAGLGAGFLEAMRGKWWLLGGIVLFALVSVVGLSFVRQSASPPDVEWAYGPYPDTPQDLKRDALDKSKFFSDRPTAELWEKLTESRIELDESETVGTANEETEENNKKEKTKETISEEGTPGWVENPPRPIGNVYRSVVTSDLFATEAECYDQLERKFYDELQICMKRILPESQRPLLARQSISAMGIPPIYFLQNVCRDSHVEVVTTSVGPMKKVHALMEFDKSTQQDLREKWIGMQRRLGLTTVLKLGTLVLTALVVGFVLLQVDTWTRGYYTKRLLVGVPVAIIAMALLLFA